MIGDEVVRCPICDGCVEGPVGRSGDLQMSRRVRLYANLGRAGNSGRLQAGYAYAMCLISWQGIMTW